MNQQRATPYQTAIVVSMAYVGVLVFLASGELQVIKDWIRGKVTC